MHGICTGSRGLEVWGAVVGSTRCTSSPVGITRLTRFQHPPLKQGGNLYFQGIGTPSSLLGGVHISFWVHIPMGCRAVLAFALPDFFIPLTGSGVVVGANFRSTDAVRWVELLHNGKQCVKLACEFGMLLPVSPMKPIPTVLCGYSVFALCVLGHGASACVAQSKTAHQRTGESETAGARCKRVCLCAGGWVRNAHMSACVRVLGRRNTGFARF